MCIAVPVKIDAVLLSLCFVSFIPPSVFCNVVADIQPTQYKYLALLYLCSTTAGKMSRVIARYWIYGSKYTSVV